MRAGLGRWQFWVASQSDLVMEDGHDSVGGSGGYEGVVEEGDVWGSTGDELGS